MFGDRQRDTDHRQPEVTSWLRPVSVGAVPFVMRTLLLVLLVAPLGCQTLRYEAPDVQARVEARWADVLAAAQSPDVDGESFAQFVAWRDGAGTWRDTPRAEFRAEDEAARDTYARVLLSALRDIARQTRQSDGRVVYTVDEYVTDGAQGVRWHVLRVSFDPGDGGRIREVEVGFIGTPRGFELGRLER